MLVCVRVVFWMRPGGRRWTQQIMQISHCPYSLPSRVYVRLLYAVWVRRDEMFNQKRTRTFQPHEKRPKCMSWCVWVCVEITKLLTKNWEPIDRQLTVSLITLWFNDKHQTHMRRACLTRYLFRNVLICLWDMWGISDHCYADTRHQTTCHIIRNPRTQLNGGRRQVISLRSNLCGRLADYDRKYCVETIYTNICVAVFAIFVHNTF